MKKIVKINLLLHNRSSLPFLLALFCILQLSFVNTYAQPATGSTVRVFAPPPKPTMPIDMDSLAEPDDLPLPEVAEKPDANVEKGDADNKATGMAPTTAYRRTTPKKKSIVDGEVETITVNGVSFNMVGVKGGSFVMGGTEEQGTDAEMEEQPTHMVTLGDFSIGETEVTQELWEAVMGKNPSHYKGAQLPVECVRYVDCEVFFFRLNFLTSRNFRLPTEAEWEFAARGGNKGKPTKYAGSDDYDAVAWYCNNSGNVTHEVKGKNPNELGIYDMSGNVDEWCDDSWVRYTDMPQTNPKFTADHEHKVRRGGGCLDFAKHLRVSDRRGSSSKVWNFDIGLRLAE